MEKTGKGEGTYGTPHFLAQTESDANGQIYSAAIQAAALEPALVIVIL